MKKFVPSESFTFLSGLAKKINAPLKSVLLSSQKLLDTYKVKDFEYISFKDYKHLISTLEQMNNQINLCYQTTQRLIDLDKSNPQHEACDINEVIKDVLDLMQRQIFAYKIKKEIHLKKDLPKVKLSQVEGHQVVHNVISNAIQAMPAGGIVKVRTSMDRNSRSVVVEISDEGVGIAPTHLSKVYEPFFTTFELGAEKTSGVGLSIVYSIIQASGGQISIQSSLRKGTQVKILLPVFKND